MAIYKTTDKNPAPRFIESVLNRDSIPYRLLPDAGGSGAAFEVDLDKEQFNTSLKDAACEAQMESQLLENGCRVPVYSIETLTNPEKLRRLQGIYLAERPEGRDPETIPILVLESDLPKADWLFRLPALAGDCMVISEELVLGALRLADYEREHGPVDDYAEACRIAGLESPCPDPSESAGDVSERYSELIEELLSETLC